MYKIVLLIGSTIITINFLYALLPSGNYEKYSKYILGLIIILVLLSGVSNIELSNEILSYEDSIPTFNKNKIQSTINEQTEKILEEKISLYLKSNNITFQDVKVDFQDNVIKKILIISDNDKNEIYDLLMLYCGTEKNIITIK